LRSLSSRFWGKPSGERVGSSTIKPQWTVRYKEGWKVCELRDWDTHGGQKVPGKILEEKKVGKDDPPKKLEGQLRSEYNGCVGSPATRLGRRGEYLGGGKSLECPHEPYC